MSIGTGFDHENNVFYNQGDQDQYWYLTHGPATYTYPMCAISQGQVNQGFVSANSTRISVNFTSIADGNMTGNVNNCDFNDDPYRFKRDFCVNTGLGNPIVQGNLNIAAFIGDLNVSDIRLFGPGLGGGGLALSTTCWPQAVQTPINGWNTIPFETGIYTLVVDIGNDWGNTGSNLFPNWNGPTAMSLQMAVGLNCLIPIFTNNAHFGKRVGLCAPAYAPDVFFNLSGITCIPPAGTTTVTISPFNNGVGENTYTVAGPGSPTINGSGLFTAVVGTYTVTSTDVKGCNYTATIEIFSNTVNPPIVTLNPASICIAPGSSGNTI